MENINKFSIFKTYETTKRHLLSFAFEILNISNNNLVVRLSSILTTDKKINSDQIIKSIDLSKEYGIYLYDDETIAGGSIFVEDISISSLNTNFTNSNDGCDGYYNIYVKVLFEKSMNFISFKYNYILETNELFFDSISQ